MILQGNALHLPLADGSVHCCVTSPLDRRMIKRLAELIQGFPSSNFIRRMEPSGKHGIASPLVDPLTLDGNPIWALFPFAEFKNGQGVLSFDPQIWKDGFEHGSRLAVGCLKAVERSPIMGMWPFAVVVPAKCFCNEPDRRFIYHAHRNAFLILWIDAPVSSGDGLLDSDMALSVKYTGYIC